ncbi:hypothetical protein AFK68_05935, partial [Hydrocoleum sp. CS-953]|uniref:hypothetical protein n=1 Tax=Hydrocoleum sp. CS-953 TaxID=1671698 RepID=UPI000BC993BB
NQLELVNAELVSEIKRRKQAEKSVQSLNWLKEIRKELVLYNFEKRIQKKGRTLIEIFKNS